MSYSLVVGEPYPRQVNWPKSGANLVLHASYVEVIYSFDGLTPGEQAAFTTGSAALAVTVGDRHLMWCYRFEAPTRPGAPKASLGWGDSPWEAYRQRDRTVGVPGQQGEPFTAHMVLVDASTSIVEGLRTAEINKDVADALRYGIARQVALPYDHEAASREIEAMYRRHPSTQSLLREAIAGQQIPPLDS
ncbi:hypothetical protein [Streptomyces sp. Ncost-T10-10d]|uniref:hypothetical protein n=1 Tax=Streptomyces sp. Ncost-T10-10d TaxID=1839774 RepID=UPI00081D62EF|nr:hypothetical protein [Streptomyces sp. Ncost-T10-10d]SCF75101.1 hypothetical protein GA0115254_115677 [Streptomyces sp. Ncost-T10-10d]